MGQKIKYQQGNDLRWKTNEDVTRAGVCFALSLEFIIWIATGKGGNLKDLLNSNITDENQMAQNELTRIMLTRMTEQKRRLDNATESDEKVKAKQEYAIEIIETNTKLKVVGPGLGAFVNFRDSLEHHKNPWAAQVAKVNGLKYISMTGTKEGKDFGHGIAVVIAPNQWGIFDPNQGVYSASNLEEFKTDFISVVGAYFEGNYIVQKIMFVTFQ